MKNLLLSLLVGLSVTGMFMHYSKSVQSDISNNVLRLHIVANSNQPKDQALKLKIRDSIICYLSDIINQDADLNQTKQIINQNLASIQAHAQDEVFKNGYSYPVSVQLNSFMFPTKHYDNFSLPRGKYEALRIAVGSEAGNNWWCVLYPNLCFVDGTVVMPKNSSNKLKGVLTEDEISLISNTDQFPVLVKFKIVEIFSNLHI